MRCESRSENLVFGVILAMPVRGAARISKSKGGFRLCQPVVAIEMLQVAVGPSWTRPGEPRSSSQVLFQLVGVFVCLPIVFFGKMGRFAFPSDPCPRAPP